MVLKGRKRIFHVRGRGSILNFIKIKKDVYSNDDQLRNSNQADHRFLSRPLTRTSDSESAMILDSF